MLQLALDGSETTHPVLYPHPLNERQRELLRWLRELGEARSAQIGAWIHAARERPCPGRPGRIGCCERAATEGWRAMLRLERRGLVEHVERGRWRALPGKPEADWPTQRVTVPVADQAEIVRLYRQGHSLRDVAERAFWSPTEVRRVLRANGVRLRPTISTHVQITTEETLARTELYGRGYSMAEIAELRGVSPSAVVATLIREGVQRRSSSQALTIAYARGRRSRLRPGTPA